MSKNVVAALLYNRAVLVADFDFPLPAELIAQEPLADRAAARLLHLVRATNSFEDRVFAILRSCCGRATCWFETIRECFLPGCSGIAPARRAASKPAQSGGERSFCAAGWSCCSPGKLPPNPRPGRP